MFEKLKKILKRNCKKQGRNISICTVVAFLLSCNMVMAEKKFGYRFVFTQGNIKITEYYVSNSNDWTFTEEGKTTQFNGKFAEDKWEVSDDKKIFIQNGTINLTLTSDYNTGVIESTGTSNFVSSGTSIGSGDKVYGLNLFFSSNITFIQNGTIAISYTETNAGDFNDSNVSSNLNKGNGFMVHNSDNITVNVNGNVKGETKFRGNDNADDRTKNSFRGETSANGIYITESNNNNVNIKGTVSGKTIFIFGNNTKKIEDSVLQVITSANGIYIDSKSNESTIGNITGIVSGNAIIMGKDITSFKIQTAVNTFANGICTPSSIGNIVGTVSGNAILTGGNNISSDVVIPSEITALVLANAYSSANGIYTTDSIKNITGSINGFAILQRGKVNEGKANICIQATSSANGINFTNSTDINNSGKIQGYTGFYDNDGNLLDKLEGKNEDAGENVDMLKFSGNGIAFSEGSERNVTGVEYENTFNNKGVIAGSESAVAVKSVKETGAINNYGIMAGKEILGDGEKFVGAIEAESFKNYGLQLKLEVKTESAGTQNDGDDGTSGTNKYSLVVKEIVDVDNYAEGISEVTITPGGESEGVNYTIWNANIKKNTEEEKSPDEDKKIYTETESIKLYANKKYTNYIFNGIDNTVSSNGNASSIQNSVINAFKTAVNMEGGTLYVTDTVINGGADISYTYNKDKFNQEKYDPTNPDASNDPENMLHKETSSPALKFTEDKSKFYALGKSVINGDIKVESKDNEITLGLYSQLNGDIIGNGADNTLHLGTVAENETVEAGATLNIQHDITNIDHIDIDNSVTFYENISVTGNEITIAKDGVLNLRLAKTEKVKDGASVAEHALDEFSGTIKGYGDGNADSATVGTLRFITQGIGKQIFVPFASGFDVENIKVKLSTIIDNATKEGDGILIEARADLGEENIIILEKGDIGDPDLVNPDPDDGFEEYDSSNPPTEPGPEEPGPNPDPGKPSTPYANRYAQLNDIYKSIYSSGGANLDALRNILMISDDVKNYDEVTDEEQLKNLMNYLNGVYSHSPYAFSSELSRKSVGMFRDIVTDNSFIPNYKKWLVMGGLTHQDAGTTDTYYGKNYHGFDTGTADVDADSKLTGAYVLAKYGYSDKVTLGITAGGNKGDTELSTDSKVKDNAGYVGGFVENYRGNLTLKAGAGVQYSEFDATRKTINDSYSDKYSDMAYDIYGSLRYSLPLDNNFFLEPYGVLSYTHVDQEGADEGNKALAIETDDKEFNYTTLKTGIDLKKVIPTEKAKHTLTAGVSYERFLDGDHEEYITGRINGEEKDGTDFDILVAHKNKHQISLNAKYEVEREDGILFNLKGEYSFQRDEHNNGAKNKTEGEWTVGASIGYKF